MHVYSHEQPNNSNDVSMFLKAYYNELSLTLFNLH